MKQLTVLITTMFLSIALFSNGQNIPDAPNPPRLVNDLAGLMDASNIRFLEDSLVRFAKRTSTHVTVVTVNTFDGTDAADFAQKLGQKWGVGQKSKNNGVVVLVKPKTEDSKGQAFIATGYGLEGALPDVTCSRIVNNVMIPHFKQNDYAGGIVAGAVAVMKASDAEYVADPDDSDDASLLVFFLLYVLFIVLVVYLNKNKRGNGGGGNRMTSSKAVDWVLLNSALSHDRHASDWGSFRGGSGSFGGGFGGFGGGSFGGGGGGGSW